jgi:aspartate-semialdehyde dehydrogenase
MKMVNESRKILGLPNLRVTATTVRVPVEFSHSISVNAELESDFSLSEVVQVLGEMPGVVVVDDPAKNRYPLAAQAKDRDETFVGRIRRDFSVDSGLNFWVVADNLRKGAATNALQIAEFWVKNR